MKRTKDELLENAKTLLGENISDEALAFLEDISDTITTPEVDWEQKYNENDAAWRQKYRDRFYSDVKPEEEEYEKDDPLPNKKIKFEDLFEEV